MAEPTPPQVSNTLGLDFQQLSIKDNEEPAPEVDPSQPSPSTQPESTETEKRGKPKPYVNPDRVKTGGAARDKLSDEALAERMARIREQNEKIKQRRLDVQADEEAFRKSQEQERQKQAQNRKVQDSIDQARDKNAQRKMEKAQSREWDSGKPTHDSRKLRAPQSPQGDSSGSAAENTSPPPPPPPSDQWVRGGSPTAFRGGRGRGGRGRGRGRGRGNHGGGGESRPDNTPTTEQPTESKPAESTS